MQFELYLIRHGHAERHNDGGDARRELTPDGKLDVQTMAEALSRAGHSFDALVTSPFVRARQTASIWADATDFDGVVDEWAGLVPSAPAAESREELLTRGRSMPSDAKLAVFSHNPHVTILTSLLVANHRDTYFNIRPGDVVHLLIPETMPFKKPGEGPAAVVLGYYPAPLVCALSR